MDVLILYVFKMNEFECFLGLEAVFFSPQAQTVSEGEGVFLQCVSGDSSPPAHITWLKDGTLVTTGRQIQVGCVFICYLLFWAWCASVWGGGLDYGL